MSDKHTSKKSTDSRIERRSILKSGVAAGATSAGLAAAPVSATDDETNADDDTDIFKGPEATEVYRLNDGELVIRDEFRKEATPEEIDLYERQKTTLNKMQSNGDLIIEKRDGDIVSRNPTTSFGASGCGENNTSFGVSIGWTCNGATATVKVDHENTQDALTYDNTFISLTSSAGFAIGGKIGAGAAGLAAAVTVDQIEAADEGCGIEIELCFGSSLPLPVPPGVSSSSIDSQNCCVSDGGGWV